MDLVDDLELLMDVCDEKNVTKIIVEGIKGTIQVCIMDNKKSEFFQLSKGQIEEIRQAHPKKANIVLRKANYQKVGSQLLLRDLGCSQYIGYSDLWISRNELVKSKNSEIRSDQKIEKYAEYIEYLNDDDYIKLVKKDTFYQPDAAYLILGIKQPDDPYGIAIWKQYPKKYESEIKKEIGFTIDMLESWSIGTLSTPRMYELFELLEKCLHQEVLLPAGLLEAIKGKFLRDFPVAKHTKALKDFPKLASQCGIVDNSVGSIKEIEGEKLPAQNCEEQETELPEVEPTEQRNKRWQQMANEINIKQPCWNKDAIAEEILAQEKSKNVGFLLNVNTIKRNISLPRIRRS